MLCCHVFRSCTNGQVPEKSVPDKNVIVWLSGQNLFNLSSYCQPQGRQINENVQGQSEVLDDWMLAHLHLWATASSALGDVSVELDFTSLCLCLGFIELSSGSCLGLFWSYTVIHLTTPLHCVHVCVTTEIYKIQAQGRKKGGKRQMDAERGPDMLLGAFTHDYCIRLVVRPHRQTRKGRMHIDRCVRS